jgi:osmotically-inducible protein OsmY
VRTELKALLLAVAIPVAVQLSGCAAVAGAGVVSSAAVAHDRRTTGTIIDDQMIEFRVNDALQADADLQERAHVNVTSFNGVVLLTGEAPDDGMKGRIGDLTANIVKVRQVHNELALAAPSTLLARSSDTWLTSKVKATLFSELSLEADRIKVVSEKGVVYLMGLVTVAEADRATEIVRRISGVQRVVRLFERIG